MSPGMTTAGGQCEQLVSLLDIYPTLTALCGLPSLDHLDGKSLVPLLKNPNGRWSDHAITAFDEQIAVRTPQYRYIRYQDGTDELYDRTKDPHEWTNQSNNPEFAMVKKKLNAMLPAPDEMIPALVQKTNKKKQRKADKQKRNTENKKPGEKNNG